MNFYKIEKKPEIMGVKEYAVYMSLGRTTHYVCDMTDGNAAENVEANELGLTLRARLTRSNGAYAMLKGTIFNPSRLLNASCEITDYKKQEFIGGDYKDGYTLLTITVDGCENAYMIFSKDLLKTLISEITNIQNGLKKKQ